MQIKQQGPVKLEGAIRSDKCRIQYLTNIPADEDWLLLRNLTTLKIYTILRHSVQGLLVFLVLLLSSVSVFFKSYYLSEHQ